MSFWLQYLKEDHDAEPFERVAENLGRCIANSNTEVERANQTGDGMYAEDVAASELEVIESLLGTAFVLYQTYITGVVSIASKFHERAKTAQKTLAAPNGRPAVLTHGQATVAGTAYTLPQAIDAFANFFKHRDEWPANWAQASGQSAKTIAVISAFGLTSTALGNLVAAATSVGVSDLEKIEILMPPLKAWRLSVVNAFEVALKAAGVE